MIDELKSNPPSNSVILSFDAKAKIPLKQYTGALWTETKKVFVAAKQKVKGLLELFAARNLHDNKFHFWFFDWKNAFTVVECFQRLLNIYRGKDIYIILDNWSAHKANIVKIFTDLNPRLHLVFLPTNASWMNNIERDFAKMDKKVLHNSNFDTVEDLMSAINQHFEMNKD